MGLVWWNPFTWGKKEIADESASSYTEEQIKKAYCPAMKAPFPYGACKKVHDSLKTICIHGTVPGELNDEYFMRCQATAIGTDLLHCDDTNGSK